MFRRTILAATLAALALPAVAEVPMGDDGLHKPDWLRDTFLDVAEDHADALADGRTLMLLIEQRGCIYCRQMHEDVFTQPEVEAYIEDNYYVVQLNMFGDLEITDLDGTALPERDMIGDWGMLFTPTMMLFPDDLPEGERAPQAAVAVMPGAFGASTTIDLLTWVHEGLWRNEDEPFQKYHARMIEERGSDN